MDSRSQPFGGEARRVLDFAAAVAGCVDRAGLDERFMALPRLVGADGVIVIGGRRWMGEVSVEVGDGAVYSPELLAAVGRGWRDHPVMVSDLRVGGTGVRRLSDFLSPREWRRRDLFNDFYRPLGMTEELSVQLSWAPGGSSCCVALHRAGRDFSDRDRTMLGFVAPHLRAARARIAAEARATRQGALGHVDAASLARRLPITPREAEVLARLAGGRTNDGIATDLGISRHTVVRHVEHLYRKLGIHTRTAATRLALGAPPDEP